MKHPDTEKWYKKYVCKIDGGATCCLDTGIKLYTIIDSSGFEFASRKTKKQAWKVAYEQLTNANFICDECADHYGGHMPAGHVATYHIAECSICGEKKTVN